MPTLVPRDLPCPACAYNLRGLRAPVCPECGLALTPEVFRAAARRLEPGAWSRAHSAVIGLFALAATGTAIAIATSVRTQSPSDFAFLAAWTFAPFLETCGLFVLIAHFTRKAAALTAGVCAVLGLVLMHWVAWGPCYHEIAGAPIAGFVFVPIMALGAGVAFALVGLLGAIQAGRWLHDAKGD